MKPRKPTKEEMGELADLYRSTIEDEFVNVLIPDAAIAVFDDYETPHLPEEEPRYSGKLMVCVYVSYPVLVHTYIWRDGKMVEIEH